MIAALDVGGTKISGILLSDAALTSSVDAAALTSDLDAADTVPTSPADLHALAARLAARGPVTAVGVSFCEYVDGNHLTSREVVPWERQPIDWLPEVFGNVPVVVESDVRCGLLAELIAGAAVGSGSAVYISWGTGLSSAFALGGMIWSGRRGRAIALGEWPAPAGNLESYVSGAGMAARAGGDRTAYQLMVADDAVAREVVASAGRTLADAIAALVAVLDPDRVVLGGGLGGSEHPARQALFARWAALGTPARLSAAVFGRHASLLGAAYAARPAPFLS